MNVSGGIGRSIRRSAALVHEGVVAFCIDNVYCEILLQDWITKYVSLLLLS